LDHFAIKGFVKDLYYFQLSTGKYNINYTVIG